MKKSIIHFILRSGVGFLILLAAGTLSAGTLSDQKRPSVFVSILPQKYFVEQISSGLINVNVMVKPGASPATYEPKPSQMTQLASSRLYFAIGVPFELAWLDKIASASPEMTVIHTDSGIEKHAMAAHHHDADDHKPEIHDHDTYRHEAQVNELHAHETYNNGEPPIDETLDPHIWLSPPLVKIQAKTILAALKKTDPQNSSFYETNFKNFIQRIDKLDQSLSSLFNDKKGMKFMVFHPSWGYFAKAYDLIQIPIEIQGKNPKPAQLGKLINLARAQQINIIFVQPQFSTKSARLIAKEIHGRTIFADPLAEDWLGNLETVAQNFKEAVK